MARNRTPVTTLTLAALLSACSGGGGGSTTSATVTPTPTPAATTAGCSLRDRQDWAAAQLREWYLFPDTLPAALDPTAYSTVGDYVDALTATARSQRKDRYFTYLTSIASEDAFYASGASAGFGFRLSYDSTARRVFIAETFEGTAASAAGIDRGAEIVAIGTSAGDLRTVDAIIAAQGTAGVTTALGPNTTGIARLLRITDSSGTRDVTLAKTDYALTPVSSRYGAQIITDGGQQIGYINLRSFISTADPALRAAFARFKTAGISTVIVDVRYNGGGLVSIAELMANLLGGARSGSDVIDYTTFRPEKSASNVTAFFAPQPQSIAPTRIAFIGTGGTASASELVIAQAIPYFHANAALIGTNTYGKPVGQIALDRAQCDDRLRVIAFALQNAARQGAYYDGLASIVEASCQASDDLTHPLGDPQEASTRAALNYLAGKSCPAIAAGTQGTLALRASATTRELLTPERPDTTQREVPGAF
ncbi:S41 family peptidase [Sphingomonas sp. CARO-RG-8B-R24-01]|uniref:S41 family peptidase n=1 Tax=Sphingomonas sp. CARO-RG-8B-R24-01 TaxID=2914831 RepID=UPI001F5615B8|nr:S41 family peptidase [Sphingomonas sp. CARO-RG-8B-R24-01]